VIDRRHFLQTGAAVVAAPALRNRRDSRVHESVGFQDPVPSRADIVHAALIAARDAGATYADVHVRDTQDEQWFFRGTNYGVPSHVLHTGVGVRALVGGAWGAAQLDGIVSLDAAAQAGRTATMHAKIATKHSTIPIELAPAPVVTGEWIMPIEIDPFTVSFQEKVDFIMAMIDFIQRVQYGVGVFGALTFRKERRTCGTSEGTLVTQTLYCTGAGMSVGVPPEWQTERDGSRGANFLTATGAGWEYLRTAPWRDKAATLIAQALSSRHTKPVDVGRYDIVFDAPAMASLLDASIGTATALDRAMGYETNGVGSSYLTDPLAMAGTFTLGSPLLTVTANRTMPRGAATVCWDEEGVTPIEITLVEKGVVTDFQTTRESATWLAPYYRRKGNPLHSNGCAGANWSGSPVTTWSPNLVLTPGSADLSFDDLVKHVKKGLAVVGGRANADFQALNGTGFGEIVYEITNGVLGQPIQGAEYLFRAPDFWKHLAALGGARSVQHVGIERWRDEYVSRSTHTVAAVPALVIGVGVTDYLRKA